MVCPATSTSPARTTAANSETDRFCGRRAELRERFALAGPRDRRLCAGHCRRQLVDGFPERRHGSIAGEDGQGDGSNPGGFAVRREGDELQIRRGLLQRRQVTLRVGRVRAVRVIESPPRQPLGLATLRVEVIGFAKETAAQTLFPLLRRDEVEPFLRELLPELADGLDGLEPPPRRALRRYVLPPLALTVAAGAALAIAAGSPLPLLLAPLGAAYGALRFRAAGWRLEGGRLAVRSRSLARSTVLAPAAGRESQDLAQTALQRRARLADVAVAFGKGTVAQVRHLDADVARALWVAISPR